MQVPQSHSQRSIIPGNARLGTVTDQVSLLGGKRRDRTAVICDILIEARKGASITELIYKTNLNHSVCKEYITFLTGRALIEVRDKSSQVSYVTAKRGEEFLYHYQRLREMFTEEAQRGTQTAE